MLSQNGKPAADGNYSIHVVLYADANGAESIWSDKFNTTLTSGVFNIMLGSGATTLPSSTTLDRPLWIGIQVEGQPEMRPLAQLSAAPYALNVADSSISSSKLQTGSVTWDKIGAEYVPYLRVNGAKISTNQSSINFTGGPGVKLDYDSSSMSVIIRTNVQVTPRDTGKGPKIQWVGEGAAANNAGATTLWNVVAGGAANTALPSATLAGYASIIGGEGNKVTGTWSTIGGGDTNLIHQGLYSVIGGGLANHDTGSYSFIGGGKSNSIKADEATIGGGSYNYIDWLAYGGVIAGGDSNSILGNGNDTKRDFIGAGVSNKIIAGSGLEGSESGHSVIGGGKFNRIYEGPSFIGGGESNIVGQEWASVVGGNKNTDSADFGFIGGGSKNRVIAEDLSYIHFTHGVNDDTDGVAGGKSSIVGGGLNSTTASFDFIGGGYRNSAPEDFATIPGGTDLRLGAFSFGFNGDSAKLTPSITDLSGSGAAFRHIAYFGDVNLLIGNVDNKSRELQFYSPNSSLSYAGAHYSAFKADAQSTNITYTLPPTQPSTNQVLAATSITGSGPYQVQLGWATPASGGGGGGWLITGNTGTNPVTTNNYLGTTDNNPFEIRVNDGGAANQGDHRVLRFDPNTVSANIIGGFFGNRIDTNVVGSIIAGGGLNNGINRIRDNFAFIGGGSTNLIDSGALYSVITGGWRNYIQGPWSVIGGGDSNYITNTAADHNVIGGGYKNVEANPSFGVIGGGLTNLLDVYSWASTIGGGDSNIIRGHHAFIGGGRLNTIEIYDDYSTLGGGAQNRVWSNYTFLGGGYKNFAHGLYSTLGGGDSNTLQAYYGFLGGGFRNEIDYNSDTAVLVGGAHNYINFGKYSLLGGGLSNTIISPFAVLGGGTTNRIDTSSEYSVLVGGQSNYVFKSALSFLGGGSQNRILSGYGVLGGGFANTIDTTSGDAVVTGGQNNRISGTPGGALVGGEKNAIVARATSTPSGVYFYPSYDNFLGGGDSNQILSSNGGWNALGGGWHNIIFGASYNFLGGGYENSLLDNYGVIDGGRGNKVFGYVGTIAGGDTNVVSGDYGAIPGGRGLISQSYSQFVAGRYNLAQGTSTTLTVNQEDALAIFGNGTDVTHRSTAVAVSNDGHLVVSDKNHSGGANALADPSPIALGGRAALAGTLFQDNLIYASGDVMPDFISIAPNANATVISDFGVQFVTRAAGSNAFVVSVNLEDPFTAHIKDTLEMAQITVTVVDTNSDLNSATGCGYATVSRIGVPGPNKFIVRTYSGTPSNDPNSCHAVPLEFMFHVVGRPKHH
jgi:hypothetical protein